MPLLYRPTGLPNVASGSYFFPASQNGSTTSATLGVGTLRLTSWYVSKTISLAGLSVDVTAAGEAGSLFRIGVYADTGTALPGALVLDAGTVAVSAIAKVEATMSLTLAPGVYWIGGAVQNVVTTQPTLTICQSTGYCPPVPVAPHAPSSFTLAGINGAAIGVNATGVTGALPGTFTSSGPTTSVPRLIARVA